MPKREVSSGWHVHDGQRQVGIALFVHLEHLPVVHLVDVVAGEDHHGVGAGLAQIVDVLEHGVGRAAVPLLMPLALVGLHQPHAAAGPVEIPGPADADVLVERARQVLRQHADVEDARVDAVGEGEVDDAEPTGKGDGRLGPVLGEDAEARTRSAGKDQCHNTHCALLPRLDNESAVR